jgi:hypothetical protein
VRFDDINSTFLKDNYLFGIPLEDMYGNKMQEGLLEHYIKSAIEHTQRMLQILIIPEEIEEVHDYYQNDFLNWGYMQLHKRPIIDIYEMSMNFGERKMFEIPKAWLRHYGITGQVEIFPTHSITGGMILTRDGSFLPMIQGRFQNAPSMWRIKYRAGMEDVPEDMVEYIMKRASVGILQVWGDLIIGAGIANQTISIDGLSQSIGTTQSPEFSGAGARIKNYMDDMKEIERRLKDTYLGINLGVI